jgi:hypothetical protein
VSDPDVHPGTASIEVLWIPLGTGATVVRLSGRLFEAASAVLQRRRRCDLYHSALTVTLPEGRVVVEMAPRPDLRGAERGVEADGPVGLRWLGRWRLFRYEIRRWLNGVIPDEGETASRAQLAIELPTATALLDLVPMVPTPVWGRDELHAGEMWNSNSVTSWLLCRTGLDAGHFGPPDGGRAPGWNAGVVVAARVAHSTSADRFGLDRGSPARTGQER